MTTSAATECPRHAGESMPCGHCAMDAMGSDEDRTFVPVHLLRDGRAVTVCCGRTPFELPVYDRLTMDPKEATCCG